MKDVKLLLDLALQASQAASQEILSVYNSNDFQTELKGDNSPLTLADKKAHQAIVQILQSSNLPILSEEGKSIPYEERKNWSTFWMVDPLDGTKEFIKRNGEFTVNIALIQNNKPLMGVVSVPVTGEIYYGGEGLGAFLQLNGKTTELPPRKTIDLNRSGLRIVASRSHMNDDTQQFIDSLKNPSLVSSGSSLKFMLLVSDKADVYPRFAPTMEWDTAAAHAVVNAVGLKVFQHNSPTELMYNKEDLLNPFFLCK
ncbi:MAG TPA: 3'(2'),5'-bisphosphate nucleotidase CysQ [Cyclobacteriaceae bacterium]|nr:3'(2'),5'-bisphosphate nucleotidase CysQ [Cyclobacteriaceae bacterium]